MSGEFPHHPFGFAHVTALQQASDLSAEDRRAVYDAIADGVIEGAEPNREALLGLIAFATGHITFDEYKRDVRGRADRDCAQSQAAAPNADTHQSVPASVERHSIRSALTFYAGEGATHQVGGLLRTWLVSASVSGQ